MKIVPFDFLLGLLIHLCYRCKNVLFEISATENPGVFDVNAKFMGVNMDKVELVFQVCNFFKDFNLSYLFV